MAQIIQRIRKDGKKSYLIRVMVGCDTSGKKVIKNTTFTPDREITEKEILKSLNAFAANFELQAAADWKNAIDKCINGKIIEMTPEEIAAMNETLPEPLPTEEERIAALEAAILELGEAIANG